MGLLPLATLAIVITIYVGGPERALDLLEALAYSAWDQSVLMLRR